MPPVEMLPVIPLDYAASALPLDTPAACAYALAIAQRTAAALVIRVALQMKQPTRHDVFSLLRRARRVSALLVALLVFGAALPARAATPPAAAADGTGWSISWNITASGSVPDPDDTIRRRIEIAGSATVRTGQDGWMEAKPFNLTVRDDREEIRRIGDDVWIDRRSITDAGRYNGGPDEFWYYPYDFEPRVTDSGKLEFPPEIFGLDFFINGDLARTFTYRGDHYDSQDGWLEPFFEDTPYYSVVLLNQPGVDRTFTGLPSNADGSAFVLDASYIAHEELATPLEMQVRFHAEVRKLGGCAAKPAPIDINDPVLKNHPLDLTVDADNPEIAPDGTAHLRAYLTCEGRPIKNATLKVASIADHRSGFHFHDQGRPNGYINGVKMALASPPPAIPFTTDQRGMVAIAFQPGKDTKNERIGIAGTYTIVVGSVDLDVIKIVPIQVRLRGLAPVQQDSGKLIVDPDSLTYQHAWNNFGTPATLQALSAIADSFQSMQMAMNDVRVQQGKAAWPIVPLFVNDISLPWGGLFDVRGWDAQAGRVRGAAWQPPHYGHADGTMVDFSARPFMRYFAAEQQAQGYKVLRTLLQVMSERYGDWAGGPTLTLKVRQGGAASLRPLASGPDAGVVAFLGDPDAERNPVAAPGQVVDLTFAVDNLQGSAATGPMTLVATLPAGLTFRGATPAPTRVEGAQIVWELGDLPAQAFPSIFSVQAEVGANVAAGTTLTVPAQVSSAADVNAANNQASIALVARPLGADLGVQAELDAPAHVPGRPATLSILVANNGTAAASQGALSLTLPGSVTLLEASAGATVQGTSVRWPLGALAPNQTQALSVTVVPDAALATPLDDNTPAPALRYALSASAANEVAPDDNQAGLEYAVERAGADVRVGLSVAGGAGGAVAPGQELTYTVLYGNYGNQPAAATKLSLSLGAGLELVSAQPAPSSTGASTTFTGGVLKWNLGDLAVGAQGALAVRVRAKSIPAAGVDVLAGASSDPADIQPGNTAAYDLRQRAVSAPGGGPRVYLPLARR
jgi:uncharacterized repeat protein (TIGR01451 family)